MEDAERLSDEFANSVLPVTIFFAVLAVFGGFGNIFVLYVYRYKYPPCNFRTFVTSLAATDFVSCLFVFPCEIVGHRMWFSYPKTAMWFCKLKTAIFAVAVMTTSMILLLISVDRFRKVCRPFGTQISVQNAFTICVASVIVAMMITSPIPILFGIQNENITYQGDVIEITSCEKDDAYKDTLFMPIYLIVLYYSPIIVFMVTTTFLYILILRKIFSKSFMRNTYTTTCKQEPIQNGEAVCCNENQNRNDNELQLNTQNTFERNPPVIELVPVNEEGSTDRHNIISEENAKVDSNDKSSVTDKSAVNGRAEFEFDNDLHTDQLTNSATQVHTYRRLSVSKHRITRKTVIMFVVTLIFNVTMVIYFCALFIIVRKQHVLAVVDTGSAAIFFLFWRLYFVNHVINPIVYGLLDYRFREALTNKRSHRHWYQ